MSGDAIQVENISKRYRIGLQLKKADTFAGQFADLVKAPFANFKRLANLSKFSQENDESTFWALQEINFQVKEGEVLGIIGHNGAGKSTLLKILSRITEPTTGQISIKGRVSALLEVGTGFHPELTGRENVYMNGTILGMRKKEIDAKLEEIIDFSGIVKHINTPVKFYSSGMKVRLGFSVAAHLEPEILIIDEVLAVGDIEFQRKCMGKMQDVAGKGRTVIFVSHNMDAVNNLCSRSILLKNGRIAYDGETRNSIQKYLEINNSVHSNILERRITKTSPFYISQVSIVDADDIIASTPISFDQDLYLKLVIKSEREITKAHISYEIVNAMNIRIFYSDHTDSERKIASLGQGENVVKVKLFSNYLLSGDYYIHVQLGDLITYENDHTKSIISFYINGPNLMKTHYRGLVQEVLRWNIKND